MFILFVGGCQAPSEKMARAEPPIASKTFEARIQEIADHYVQKYPAVPGVLIYCESPSLGGVAKCAAGYRDPRTRSKLEATDQFRSASISKMFVAAAVLRLSEENLFKLDDPVANFLAGDLIEGIARFNGIDYGREITIRQCLAHTSGLWDCFSDGLRDSVGRSPFELELIGNPNKFWTIQEVIAWNKTHQHAVGPPGGRFHYSDTGYQLVGLLLESVTKKPLAAAVRDLVLIPLKMTNTFAEFREEIRRPPGIERSHSFDREIDRTDSISETADWGGGGWVTNAPDLVRFLRGVSQGKLFRDPATWRLMREWSTLSDGTYGLALQRFVTTGGNELMGHGGYYGSFAAIWPNANMIVVATMNQSNPSATNGHSEVVGELVGKVCEAFVGDTRKSGEEIQEKR